MLTAVSKNRYIIAGDYVNAISIWHSLTELGIYKDEVAFINLSGRNLSGLLYPAIETINHINNFQELLKYLISFDKCTVKFLFLTSELFHIELWNHRDTLLELNVVFHIGNSNPHRILSKDVFLSEIGRYTDVQVPKSFTIDEINLSFTPVFLKFRSSYLNGRRVPKGKPFWDKVKLEIYIQELLVKGYTNQDFKLQELLSTQTKDNISICGWYQNGDPFLYQTQKIIQHPPNNGNGDVVKLMDLDADLQKMALSILEHFDYQGPFELEFIKERNSSNFKLIEMNPRFWMQHGLIERLSGNLLVAKYIGRNPTYNTTQYKYWTYTTIAIIKIFTLKLSYVKYLWKKDSYKIPSVSQAIIFLFKYLYLRAFNSNK